MASLQFKSKLAYAVHSHTIEKKQKLKWIPLGKFSRKADALAAFEEHLLFAVNDTGKIITLKQILPRYLDFVQMTKAPTTHHHDRQHAMILEREFGDLRLTDITVDKVEQFRKKHDWKPTTWRNRLGLLKKILDYARDHGFAIIDPFKVIKIPRPKIWEFSPRTVSPALLDQVIAALTTPYQAMARILRYSGIRPSELYRLQADDIDLKQGTLRVISKKVLRTRFIPIHPSILDALKNVPFTRRPISFQHALNRVCDKLGESGAVTPYTFRHQFASEIVNKTGNIRAAQQLLGHATIQMTTRYAHATENTLKEAIMIL